MHVTERFSDRAENYAKFRPSYPPEAVAWLQTHLGIGPQSTIADLGCGTGIWTERLRATGARILGIEPNDAMRHYAETQFANDPQIEIRKGTAEATGLNDASVDLVTAAQAFHWFDLEPTRAEWRRILRPTGQVALIWNGRYRGNHPFMRELDQLLAEYADRDRAMRQHHDGRIEYLRQFFAEPFQEVTFAHRHALDWEGLLGRTRSGSYWPNGVNANQPEAEAMLRRLFERYAADGYVEMPYRATLFVGRV